MSTQKRTVAAWLTVAVLCFDLIAETLRLGICIGTPPGPAATACYDRVGPVSQAFQKLRLVLEAPPPPVAPTEPPPPPVVVPKGGTTMEQLRKQPSL